MEITYADTLLHQNSQFTHVDSLYKKNIDIGQYMLKLFENFAEVRFSGQQCK